MKIVPNSRLLQPVLDLHRHGLRRGDPTGWGSLDEFWSVGVGQLTVVTGVPSHGKSAIMDALAVNLLAGQKCAKPWRFLFVSPEQEPHQMHLAEMLERYVGRSFREHSASRMSEDDIRKALDGDLGSRVLMGSFDENDTFADLLVASREFIAQCGDRYQPGIVLDPWNRLEHRRPSGMSETDYVGECLTLIVSMVRATGAHVFMVAHPAKLYAERGKSERPVPSAYDIAGSAHWYNRADNILCVWRDVNASVQNLPSKFHTRVYVQKVRWRHLGQVGMASLRFRPDTGRFEDMPDEHLTSYRETNDD